MNGKHIKRRLFESLKAHLEKEEISLIVGPRQAGKTTLMEELRDFLVRSGEKTLFLSMDIEEHQPFFASQGALAKRLELEFGQTRGFVFLDEIQRKENAGLFLKGLFDMHLPHKLVVSGSGSVELKEKVHESLLGRKMLFELSTVSFAEFVDFETEYRYAGRLEAFLALEKDRAVRLLESYMSFGGYPRVVLEDTLEGKWSVMNEIYRSYIEKDIAYFLKVERIDAFSALIKILASQTGQLLNHTELSNTLDISLPTLKNYLWYAEQTFVIERVPPYFRNARKEITKAPVVYFHDLGLRNFARGTFGHGADGSTDQGFLFQNFVYRALSENRPFTDTALHFWRTKDRAEVDFVLYSGTRILPVEVKWKSLKRPAIERSLRSFIKKYQPNKALVINRDFEATVQEAGTEILFLPFWKVIEGLPVPQDMTPPVVPHPHSPVASRL